MINLHVYFLSVFLLFISISSAQTEPILSRNLGTISCDSFDKVSKEYFDKHKRTLSIIDTTGLPQKKGITIMVPFGKKQLYFTDDSATNIFLYAIVGIDKAKGWVLVKESDPQVSHYYLIDQKKLSIDTLIGYPYFLNDKVICIENEQTDGSGPIEVYQILKGRFSLIAKAKLGLCAERIKSYSFFLNEKNELMSDSPVYGEDQIVDQSYWCIKIPLF